MTGPSHGRPYRRRRCRFSTPSQASCSGHGIWQMPMPVPQVGIDDLTHGAGLVPVSVVTSDGPGAVRACLIGDLPRDRPTAATAGPGRKPSVLRFGPIV
jgi:hypothetical protein